MSIPNQNFGSGTGVPVTVSGSLTSVQVNPRQDKTQGVAFYSVFINSNNKFYTTMKTKQSVSGGPSVTISNDRNGDILDFISNKSWGLVF